MLFSTFRLILLLNSILPAFSYFTLPKYAARYDGAEVVEVKKGPYIDHLINNYDLDIWSSTGDYVQAMVHRFHKDNLTSYLSRSSIPYKVKIRNLGEVMKNQFLDSLKPRNRQFKKFYGYQRLSAIHDGLHRLAEKYPNVASVGIMGHTFENRPLKYIKISSGKPNAPAVFIDGGIHAREWISVSSVTYIIEELVENYTKLPREMLEVDFYIIPVLNPDGYEYSHTEDRMWRKNRSINWPCYGVDINRNFNIHFGKKGVSHFPCSDTYCGKRPHSELETKALSKFLLQLKGNLKAYISFHSYSQMILVPYGYKIGALPRDFSEMLRVGIKASKAMEKLYGIHYDVNNTAIALYPSSGGSDDWAKARANVKYSFTIELRDKGNFGFLLPESYILPTGREALEAVKVIAKEASLE